MIRLREAAGIGLACAAVTVLALTLLVGSGTSRQAAGPSVIAAQRTVTSRSPTSTPPTGASVPSPRPPAAPVRVRTLTVTLTDPARTISGASGTVPRSFATVIRYPSQTGVAPRPLPLIVFGHGFAVSPAPYGRLLDAWAHAGFVVAAPVFPLENAAHPGGPDEHDLPNQPADMSLVISALTGGSVPRPLSGRVDARAIAVAGQSDGGDTALAAAYDPAVRDPRVGAAVILSGAEDPFAAAFRMPADGPPLLAVQGTADTINPPPDTYAFFGEAAAPKFLLRLVGASHQPPYTEPGAGLAAVERTTIAFLDWRFRGRPQPLRRLLAAGGPAPGAVLTSH